MQGSCSQRKVGIEYLYVQKRHLLISPNPRRWGKISMYSELCACTRDCPILSSHVTQPVLFMTHGHMYTLWCFVTNQTVVSAGDQCRTVNITTQPTTYIVTFLQDCLPQSIQDSFSNWSAHPTNQSEVDRLLFQTLTTTDWPESWKQCPYHDAAMHWLYSYTHSRPRSSTITGLTSESVPFTARVLGIEAACLNFSTLPVDLCGFLWGEDTSSLGSSRQGQAVFSTGYRRGKLCT